MKKSTKVADVQGLTTVIDEALVDLHNELLSKMRDVAYAIESIARIRMLISKKDSDIDLKGLKKEVKGMVLPDRLLRLLGDSEDYLLDWFLDTMDDLEWKGEELDEDELNEILQYIFEPTWKPQEPVKENE